MRNRAFISCLPLLASSLGQRYGVTVEIGGDEAYTTGSTIRLPSLPEEADPRFVGLVRGYIDHEAAHVRFTDFEVLRTIDPNPLLKCLWNILEDWRVEQRLGQLFPGARQNFEWLIRHIFLGKYRRRHKPGFGVLDWLLLTVRSWSVPDLNRKCQNLERKIEAETPGLPARLTPILAEIRQSCPDTAACFAYAQRILEALERYQAGQTQQQDPNVLIPLLCARGEDMPAQMGELLRQVLEPVNNAASAEVGRCTVALPGQKTLEALGETDRATCLNATVAMRTRLQGLLQASRLRRVARATKGRLDPRLLYGAAVGDARLFRRSAPVRALDTHVHILLDCSGSMRERIQPTCQAAYAVAQALNQLRIPVAVTAFPGEPVEGYSTVVPILKPNHRLHDRFLVEAVGGTPLAAALWSVLIDLFERQDDRQIILILTDGEPDDLKAAQTVLRHAQVLGVEVYGLGIQTPSIATLLPGRARSIDSIEELPSAIFALLQQALVQGGAAQ